MPRKDRSVKALAAAAAVAAAATVAAAAAQAQAAVVAEPAEAEFERFVARATAVHTLLSQNGFEQSIRALEAADRDTCGGSQFVRTQQILAIYSEAFEQASKLRCAVDAALGEEDSRPRRQIALEDEVAAKIASHGLWILARVVSIELDAVECEDIDDDNSRRFTVPSSDVVLLPREPRELAEARVAYGPNTRVFAMYPDTTSFYRAEVASEGTARFAANGEEVVFVKFVDDEDDTGFIPARQIPIRFVTPLPARI